MFNFKYFICMFFIINTISGQFEVSDNYPSLIAKADLFYLNPVPNDQPEETSISELDNSFSWKSDDIKVIIHGWTADRNHVSISPLKYAYLAKGHDGVFVADWNDAARIIYFDSRYFVRPVGIKLAKLLQKFIRQNNINPEKIHILGHSLGAHIAGNIGDYFNGTIGRITGLDTAGPLFESFVADGLLPRHAKFVDCIHTAIPTLGQSLQRGHANFYPNYGKVSQPGCEILDVITATSCSHLRAPLFYAESIQLPNSFASFPCSLKSVLKERCYPKKAKNVVFMGENLSKSARGAYFLQTNNVSPFGLGVFSLAYLKFNNNSKSQPNVTSPIPTSNHSTEERAVKGTGSTTSMPAPDSKSTQNLTPVMQTSVITSVVTPTKQLFNQPTTRLPITTQLTTNSYSELSTVTELNNN